MAIDKLQRLFVLVCAGERSDRDERDKLMSPPVFLAVLTTRSRAAKLRGTSRHWLHVTMACSH